MTVAPMYGPWVTPFLESLKRTGNVSKSAALAGVSSATPYALRKHDGDFAAAWEQALEDHIDVVEEEATRRAFGYEEPVVYQGQLTPVWERDEKGQIIEDEVECPPYKVGDRELTTRHIPRQARDEHGNLQWLTVRKFSDTLLLAKLKAYRKRYSTERTELTGADGGPVEGVDATARAARVAHLMALAAARKAEQEAGSEFA